MLKKKVPWNMHIVWDVMMDDKKSKTGLFSR